jgi:ketosteroid isomerase-like protein
LKRYFALALCAASLLRVDSAAADSLPHDDALFKTIQQADAALFGASNRCDLKAFANLIDEDFEFYHDKTGLTAGKAAMVNATEKNLCHKVRRTLIESSLQVFPIHGYGAIEMGSHQFCNLVETPVCEARTSGTGRFFMLWRKRASGYKLARVISYDHVDSRERESGTDQTQKPEHPK